MKIVTNRNRLIFALASAARPAPAEPPRVGTQQGYVVVAVRCGSLPFLFDMPKVVLITGASSGIGKAIAEYLSNNDFLVFGTARNPSNYESPKKYRLISLEITSQESIVNCVATVLKEAGRIDVLINNAGRGMTGPVEELDLSAVRELFETNYFGPTALMQAVLPHMRKSRSGAIINITSIAGYMGLPFRANYSSVKSALHMLSEGMRLELAPFGIKVYTLAPGDFATDIASRRLNATVNQDSVYYETYKRQLTLFDSHVSEAMNPEVVAKQVLDILNNPPKKIHFLVAGTLQRLSVLLLKPLLPQWQYEKLIANHYKL